jgi:leucyl-tRNA synthetase
LLDGKNYQQAFDTLANKFTVDGRGARRINYRLRDWGVSRQRYWGCPIPMLFRADGSAIPVPEDQLPVVLPENVAFTGQKSPIKADPNFYQYTDPKTGEQFTRETDTFDTFMESSWYYARYCCPGADTMLDERANYWLPVDQYIGGIEHAVMHLLYFRFFHKLLRDAGMVKSDEPAVNLLCQGMVVADTYYAENKNGSHQWVNATQVEFTPMVLGEGAVGKLADGRLVYNAGVEKMSKSKLNGVDPQSLIEKYGADTVRLFSMFAAPPEQQLEWNEDSVDGAARFLRRLWRSIYEHVQAGPTPQLDPSSLTREQKILRTKVHETIAKAARDVGERYTFNTAIAANMELMNALQKFDDKSPQGLAVLREAWTAVVRMLAPIVPHITHACWTALGQTSSLLDTPYPVADPIALQKDLLTIVVQVNGKLRGQIEIAPNANIADVEAAAMAEHNVARFLSGFSIKKVIVVPNKLVNIVAVANT